MSEGNIQSSEVAAQDTVKETFQIQADIVHKVTHV